MKSYFVPFVQRFQFISRFLYVHIVITIFMKLVIHEAVYLFILKQHRLHRCQFLTDS
jgi:hypothetical protein